MAAGRRGWTHVEEPACLVGMWGVASPDEEPRIDAVCVGDIDDFRRIVLLQELRRSIGVGRGVEVEVVHVARPWRRSTTEVALRKHDLWGVSGHLDSVRTCMYTPSVRSQHS